MDISKLREDYEKATSVSYQSKAKSVDTKLDDKQLDIKNKCETIEKAIRDGKLKRNDFGGKIAETLKKYNYKFCSDKQYNILVNTISKLGEQNKTETKIITDVDIPDTMDDVYDVLDALGKGTLPTN